MTSLKYQKSDCSKHIDNNKSSILGFFKRKRQANAKDMKDKAESATSSSKFVHEMDANPIHTSKLLHVAAKRDAATQESGNKRKKT